MTALTDALGSIGVVLDDEPRKALKEALPAALKTAVDRGHAPVAAPAPTESDPTTFPDCAVPLLAVLSSTMKPDAAWRFLAPQPDALRGRILTCLVRSNSRDLAAQISPDSVPILRQLRAELKSKELFGDRFVCSILQQSSSEEQLKRAITAMAGADQATTHAIQQQLYRFEDLQKLKDAEIQLLMMHVDNLTLVQALLGADREVAARLLGNLSNRRRSLVQDDLERAEEEDAVAAQTSILDEVRKQYDIGRIETYFGSAQRRVRGPTGAADDSKKRPKPKQKPDQSGRRGKKLILFAVLLVVAGAGWFVLSNLGPTVDDAGEQPPAARKRSGGVLSKKSTGGQSSRKSAAAKSRGQSQAQVLGPGDSLNTGAAAAVVRLANGSASIRAEAETELRQGDDGETEPGPLYLRLGQLRVEVMKEDFVLETPVVAISGTKGARFTTQVVLDATTRVRVDRGSVLVKALADPARQWEMAAGRQGRFDVSGRVRVESKQKAKR